MLVPFSYISIGVALPRPAFTEVLTFMGLFLSYINIGVAFRPAFNPLLVIADLTEHNPNVMFEIGVRIAQEKPVVLMKAEGTGPLFDIDNMLRVFEYNPNLWQTTIEKDMPNLRDFIKGAWENRNPDKTYMKILRAKGKA